MTISRRRHDFTQTYYGAVLVERCEQQHPGMSHDEWARVERTDDGWFTIEMLEADAKRQKGNRTV